MANGNGGQRVGQDAPLRRGDEPGRWAGGPRANRAGTGDAAEGSSLQGAGFAAGDTLATNTTVRDVAVVVFGAAGETLVTFAATGDRA